MRIDTIAAKNFKGRSFTHSLAALTAICGLNMAGKSAVRDAIIVALLNHSPKHGKQPKSTWGFAGGRNGVTMVSVDAGLSDGKFIGHTIELQKGKLTMSSRGGPFPFVPPAMMDVRNEFLAKSGPQKVDFIFQQIDIERLGFTTEHVTARLKSDVKPKEHTEQSEACLTSLVDDVENLARERDEFRWSYQEWLTRVSNRIKDDMDAAQAVVESMEGMIAGGTQLRAQEGLQAGQNVEAELAAARKEHQDAVVARNLLDKRESEHRRKAARRDQLTKAIDGTESVAGLLAEAEARYQQEIAELQGYKSRTLEITRDMGKLETEFAVAHKAVETWTAEIAAAKAKLELDVQAPACPHCKSKGKGWKKSLTESVAETVAALEKNIEDMTVKRKEYEDALKPLRRQLEDAQKADAHNDQKRVENFRLGQNIKDLRARADQINGNKSALAELGDVGQPITPDELLAASSRVNVLAEKVRVLEQQDRERVAAMQDARRAEQARQSHAEKKIEVEVRKLALNVLKDLRVELMDTAYLGFMDKVNLFTDGILKAKLEYRDGDIGYFDGATWVGLDYFSGTEEMLALIGLSVALTQTATFKIVFVDEWLRDEQTRMAVPRRLAELIGAGIIDQAVVIDTNAAGYETIDGCKVVAV